LVFKPLELTASFVCTSVWAMTAEQIIQEIKNLPPEEQAKVIRFAYRVDAEQELTGKELSSLAARMVASADPAETAMLRDAIVRGFYGGKSNA
jgi:hypothetical protein